MLRFRPRFALALHHTAWTGDDPSDAVRQTIEQTVQSEQAGFDTVWVSEDPDGWDAFAVLSALATRTERIHLGTGVTNPYARHPNLITGSLATLDQLSSGRAFLGLGRGQPEWYREAFGMTIGSPLAALEETIDLVRQWQQPPHRATIDGQFTVRDWERTVLPRQEPPGPPIYLAATGPKALALAGRRADGVRFNELVSPEYLRWAIDHTRQAAIGAGRDPSRLRFFVHPSLSILENDEQAANAIRRKKGLMALIHTLPGMDRQLQTDAFDVPAIMAEVRRLMRTDEVLARGGAFPELRRAGDIDAARATIPDDLIRHVATIGNADHARQRLQTLAELGATDLFVRPEDVSGLNLADATPN